MKKILFILLCLPALLFAQEEVSFTATASKNSLGLNERVRIDFTMNKDGDNFQRPSFNDFNVLMGPNQSVSNSWVNGKRSFSRTYSFILQPSKKGTLTIQQASVEIEGKIYKTEPIRITVTDAVDNPNAPPTANDVAKDNLHLVAEVSNGNPYLNEAVSVVYKLYVGPNIEVDGFNPVESPKYSNFWNQEIQIDRLHAQNGTYEGKPYRYVVLKKVVLYPQQSGNLTIEPLTLDVQIGVPTQQRRGFFGFQTLERSVQRVSAGARTIKVKPLPENGKPEDFSGAVGDFDFKVTASKNELRANESLGVKIEVSGKGNLKLFSLPTLVTPSALETYDPEHEEKVNTYLSGNSGSVSDNYTIVSKYKGKYPIQPLSFSYFDPSTKTYKTINSQEIEINVLEGAESTAQAPNGNSKQEVAATGNDFKFLKLKANLKPANTKRFYHTMEYYLVLLLPLLILPIAYIVKRKRAALAADVQGNKIRKANRLAKKYLSNAKKNLGQKEAFYIALEKALHNYLKAKLHIETSEFSKEKIAELLREKGIAEVVIADFIALLTSCEQARYAPASNVTMQQDYEKASEVITTIDKQI